MTMVVLSGDITCKSVTLLVSREQYIILNSLPCQIVYTIDLHCLRWSASSAIADCAAERPDVVYNIITCYSEEVVVSGSCAIH